MPKNEHINGAITITGAGKQIVVNVSAWNPKQPELAGYKGFVENNGYVSMYASDYSRKRVNSLDSWTTINDLGHTGTALMTLPLNSKSGETSIDTAAIRKTAPYVAYEFFMFIADSAELGIFTLPTHPLNNRHSLRYALTIDDGPLKVVDFRTFGRSEEWMQHVLCNSAVKEDRRTFLECRQTYPLYLHD